MDIAVTGHLGRLGSELIRQGCIPFALNGKKIDVTDQGAVQAGVLALKPDVIVNCASFTGVDACEESQAFHDAIRVNLWGVEFLKENFPGRLIHISTDYVFSGRSGPYDEKRSGEMPVNNYGWTKMGGEVVLLTDHRPGDLLIRTTGLYGRGIHLDFFKMIYNALLAGETVQVSASLRGNQTYVPHLARAIIDISNRPGDFSKIQILNIASAEVVSRYEFALMIASVFKLDKNLLVPVTNREVPGWIAARPTRGGLKIGLAKKMRVPIYKISDGLRELYGEYMPAR